MGIKFANLASTTLASGVNATATSISVTSASSFPTLGSGDYFYASIGIGADSEIVKVTAVSGDTLTVVRAQDNTSASAHASGDEVALRVTAKALEDINESANQTITLSGDVSGSGTDSISVSVTNDSHTHAFNNLTGKDSGTGAYSTTGHIEAGRGSGGVALTHNDGYGNASVTFNHRSGNPEQTGNAGRIEVNTDRSNDADVYMSFEGKSAVTADTATGLNTMMELAVGSVKIPYKIEHIGDSDTFIAMETDKVYIKTGNQMKWNSDNWTSNTEASDEFKFSGGLKTDTITTASAQQLILNAGESNGKVGGQTNEYVYVNAEQGLIVNTPDSDHSNWQSGYSVDATVIKGSSITVDGNTVWHAGNDGAGSGLDADKLDSLDSSAFLRSNAADTMTNVITFESDNPQPIVIRRTTTANAGIVFENEDGSGNLVDRTYFGLGNEDGELMVGTAADVRGQGNVIWHEGNDGADSGLDADKLDGKHASDFPLVANGTVASDFNNYTTAGNYYVSNWNPSGGTAISNGPTYTFNTNEVQNAYGWGMLRVSNFDSSTNNFIVQEYIPHQNDGIWMRVYWSTHGWTAWRQQYTNLSDGNSDGLNADTLDGQEGSYYLDYDNFTNKPTIPSISGLASESYVDTAVSNLVDTAPDALNTLNELAAAINDDASFASTVNTNIAAKVSKSGDTMTGSLAIELASPTITLKDTSDDDDHAIYFTNSVGSGISSIKSMTAVSGSSEDAFTFDSVRDIVFTRTNTDEKLRLDSTGATVTGSLDVVGSVYMPNNTALNMKNAAGTANYRAVKVNTSNELELHDGKVTIAPAGAATFASTITSGQITTAGNSASAGLSIKRTNAGAGGSKGFIAFRDLNGDAVASIASLAIGGDNNGTLRFQTSSALAESDPYSLSTALTLDTSQNATFEGNITLSGILNQSHIDTGANKSTYGIAVFESTDAHIDVTSTSAGTWGSTILLRESHDDAYRNAWAIARKTGTTPDLVFNFGTAADHNINGTKFTFASSGNFTTAGTISSGAITSSASITASGDSNSFGNTTVSALSAVSVGASGSITAAGDSNSFGNTTLGTVASGPINASGNIRLQKEGTADASNQIYASRDLEFEASGWDTNNSLARTVMWKVRNVPTASIYPDHDLQFIESDQGSDYIKFKLHGRGSNDHTDPLSATFYGNVSVEAGTGGNAGAGALTISGNLTASGTTTTLGTATEEDVIIDCLCTDDIFIKQNGTVRATFNVAGITSYANVYTSASGEFRNYSGSWKATTGVTGNGFEFINTVDGTAATLSSEGELEIFGDLLMQDEKKLYLSTDTTTAPTYFHTNSDGHLEAYVEGYQALEMNHVASGVHNLIVYGGITTTAAISASSQWVGGGYFKASSVSALLRLDVSSWSAGNQSHDIIYNGYGSNIGDYTYIKAGGNGSTNHGIGVFGDNVFAVGTIDQNTGAVSNSATAPIDTTWMYVNSTGLTVNGTIDSGQINTTSHGTSQNWYDAYTVSQNALSKTVSTEQNITGPVVHNGDVTVNDGVYIKVLSSDYTPPLRVERNGGSGGTLATLSTTGTYPAGFTFRNYYSGTIMHNQYYTGFYMGSGYIAPSANAQGYLGDGTVNLGSSSFAWGSLYLTGYVYTQESTNNSAPRVAYSCRAWGVVNQTGTQAILKDQGFSTITDLGTGKTRLNFTATMPDANYAVTANTQLDDLAGDSNDTSAVGIMNKTNTYVELANEDMDGGFTDSPNLSVVIHR